MKVLFLDIDGVLNYEGFIHEATRKRRAEQKEKLIEMPEEWHGSSQMDPEKVALLNEIVRRTNCVIVISSSWRQRFEPPEMQKMLDNNGFEGQVVSATSKPYQLEPGGKWSRRGNEIEQWVSLQRRYKADGNATVESWAVVDDDGVAPELSEDNRWRFVQTQWWGKGLLPEHVERLVRILGEVGERNEENDRG